MPNELVRFAELPPYLRRYLQEGKNYGEDIGYLESADVGISFLKLVHKGSREADPGWDGGNAEALPHNAMFLSRCHTIIPPETPFVPLLRSVKFLKWEGRPGSGRLVGVATRKDDPRIVAEKGLEFTKDPKTGDWIPPTWTVYVNFYIMLPQSPQEPVLLSFYRTSIVNGRKLTQNIMQATKNLLVPMRTLKYKLIAPRIVIDGLNRWPQINVVPDGFIKEGLLNHVEKLHDTAAIMDQISKGTEFGQLDETTQAEPPVKQVEAEVSRRSFDEEDAVFVEPKASAANPGPTIGEVIADVIQEADPQPKKEMLKLNAPTPTKDETQPKKEMLKLNAPTPTKDETQEMW